MEMPICLRAFEHSLAFANVSNSGHCFHMACVVQEGMSAQAGIEVARLLARHQPLRSFQQIRPVTERVRGTAIGPPE